MCSESEATQKKYWIYSSQAELTKLRFIANGKFSNVLKSSKDPSLNLLTAEEEQLIVRHYENILREFMQNFNPKNEPLPRDVKGTAFHFYKRFFVVSSVMDYHPKEIMITAIFLSCKICEYCVPIEIFVKHIEGDSRLLKNIILDQEMEILHRLNFALNIHTPTRAVEGLMIDLRARSKLERPQKLGEHINRFMSNMWFTDVCLLYSPPLIALASIMHAVSRCHENIDQFIIETLLNSPPPDVLQNIIGTVRKIRSTVMNFRSLPDRDQVRTLEAKLSKCRNPANDPSSETFKRRMMEYALEAYSK